MPYVHRNTASQINMVSADPEGSTEFLPEDNPQVENFLRNPPPPNPRSERDPLMVLLIAKGILTAQEVDAL